MRKVIELSEKKRNIPIKREGGKVMGLWALLGMSGAATAAAGTATAATATTATTAGGTLGAAGAAEAAKSTAIKKGIIKAAMSDDGGKITMPNIQEPAPLGLPPQESVRLPQQINFYNRK